MDGATSATSCTAVRARRPSSSSALHAASLASRRSACTSRRTHATSASGCRSAHTRSRRGPATWTTRSRAASPPARRRSRRSCASAPRKRASTRRSCARTCAPPAQYPTFSARTRAGGSPRCSACVLLTRYVFDLEVPADVQLRPCDGEAESFTLADVPTVWAWLRDGRFKPNCALGTSANQLTVLLDFFMRHGMIPREHSEYSQLDALLHTELGLPVP